MLTRFEFKDFDAMVITSEPERADTNLKLKMLAQKAGARGRPKQTKNIKKGKEKKLRKERWRMSRGQKRANAFRCKIHLNLKVQKVKSFCFFCFHGRITLLWLLLLLLAVLLQWPSPTFTLTLMLPHQLNAELDRASMFILCWWCHTEGAAHTMGQGQAGVSIVCQEFVNGLQKCDGQMLINVHKENSQ